jgi:DNA-binding HxlR family transcriptional regulator
VVKRYGQFCPVAKALEVLGERWTLLIVRELLVDDYSFNEIRRGVPLISPSLLSSRLKMLEDCGIITKTVDGDATRYGLTDAGRELQPIVMQMGIWGQRWAPSDYSEGDLDPRLLMWDIHRRIDTSKLPEGRTVLHFIFNGSQASIRRWWLIVTDSNVDICLKDPGHDIDVQCESDIATMARVWMGEVPLGRAMAAGKLTLIGTSPLRRTASSWLKLSVFADSKR